MTGAETTELASDSRTLVLRAALLQGEAARLAHDQWAGQIQLDDVPEGTFPLLPSLQANLARLGINSPDSERLRGISKQVWARNQTTARWLGELIGRLREAGIDPILAKGPALARFYPADSQRTHEDFFLRIEPDQIEGTLARLKVDGWRTLAPMPARPGGAWFAARCGIRLTHPKHGEMLIRWRFLPADFSCEIESDLCGQSDVFEIAGTKVQALNPTASLFLALAERATEFFPVNFLWALDAVHIMRNSESSIDWAKMGEWSQKSGLHMGLVAAAGYLTNEVGIEDERLLDFTGSDLTNEAQASSILPASYIAYRRQKQSLRNGLNDFTYSEFRRESRAARSGANISGGIERSPEERALIEIARSSLREQSSEALPALLAGEFNWKRFLELGFAHNLIPLIAHQIGRDSTLSIPRPVRVKLLAHLSANRKRNELIAAELASLIDTLAAEGTEVLPYKGITLAAAAYDPPELRQSGDIDILVRKPDAPRAREIILERGYRRRDGEQDEQTVADHLEDMYHFHFVRDSDQMEIELHWQIMVPRVSVYPDSTPLWSGQRTVRMGTSELPAMSPENMVIALVIHGAKHGWPKLSMLLDLASVFRRHPDMDHGYVIGEFRRTGNLQVLAWSLGLAERLLGFDPPDEFRTAVPLNPNTLRQVENSESNFFHPHTQLTERQEFELLLPLRPNALSRLAYTLQFLSTPTRGDRRAIRLPQGLRFLYAVIRPIRLLGAGSK